MARKIGKLTVGVYKVVSFRYIRIGIIWVMNAENYLSLEMWIVKWESCFRIKIFTVFLLNKNIHFMKTKNLYGILWLLINAAAILLLASYFLGPKAKSSATFSFLADDMPKLKYLLYGLSVSLSFLVVEFILGSAFKNKVHFEKENWVKKVKVFAFFFIGCTAVYLLLFWWGWLICKLNWCDCKWRFRY